MKDQDTLESAGYAVLNSNSDVTLASQVLCRRSIALSLSGSLKRRKELVNHPQRDELVLQSRRRLLCYISAKFCDVGNFMKKVGFKTPLSFLNIHFWLALASSQSLCPLSLFIAQGHGCFWALFTPLLKLQDLLTLQGLCFFVHWGLTVLASSYLSTEQQKPFNRPVSLVLSSQSEMSCPQKSFFPFVLSSGFCSYPFSVLTVAI